MRRSTRALAYQGQAFHPAVCFSNACILGEGYCQAIALSVAQPIAGHLLLAHAPKAEWLIVLAANLCLPTNSRSLRGSNVPGRRGSEALSRLPRQLP